MHTYKITRTLYLLFSSYFNHVDHFPHILFAKPSDENTCKYFTCLELIITEFTNIGESFLNCYTHKNG